MNIFDSISSGFDCIFRFGGPSSFPVYRSVVADRAALANDFRAVQNDIRSGIRKSFSNDNQSRRKKNS